MEPSRTLEVGRTFSDAHAAIRSAGQHVFIVAVAIAVLLELPNMMYAWGEPERYNDWSVLPGWDLVAGILLVPLLTAWIVHHMLGHFGVERRAYEVSHQGVRAVGANFLYVLAMVVGFALLIVPGIILAARFAFGLVEVVAGDHPPVEALRRSWQITAGRTGSVVLVGVAVVGLLLAAMIALTIVLTILLLIAGVGSVTTTDSPIEVLVQGLVMSTATGVAMVFLSSYLIAAWRQLTLVVQQPDVDAPSSQWGGYQPPTAPPPPPPPAPYS